MRRASAGTVAALLCGVGFAGPLADEPVDFFDYLGLMVEQDGNWVDPVDMDFEADTETDPEQTEEAVTKEVTRDDEDETP